MKFSVEMTIQEGGLVRENRAYLRDNKVELADLLAWTKEQLIIIADVVLREEQARGFDKEPIMIVDGRRGKPITAINPWGQVEFVSRLADVGEPILYAYEALLELSKVLTGAYKSSHVVALNGVQIAASLRELEVWMAYKNMDIKDGDIFRIVNTQPYARRLELLGVTSTRQQARRDDPGRRRGKRTGSTIKVPNGAYQLAYRRVRAKYSKQIQISFNFLPGTSLGLSGSFKTGKKSSAGRPYLYPALSFRVKGMRK